MVGISSRDREFCFLAASRVVCLLATFDRPSFNRIDTIATFVSYIDDSLSRILQVLKLLEQYTTIV